jgi:hypothetical protein
VTRMVIICFKNSYDMNTLVFNVNGKKSWECKENLVPNILELKNLNRLMTWDIKMFMFIFSLHQGQFLVQTPSSSTSPEKSYTWTLKSIMLYITVLDYLTAIEPCLSQFSVYCFLKQSGAAFLSTLCFPRSLPACYFLIYPLPFACWLNYKVLINIYNLVLELITALVAMAS